MQNLLSANFNRLVKNKLFWLLTAVILIITAYLAYDTAFEISHTGGYFTDYYQNPCTEIVCFDFGPVVLIIMPVFISLFLGTEYSDGTMRNKIVVGQKRPEIYLANFLTTSAASLIFCAAWHIGALTALPFLGIWKTGIAGWLFSVLKSVLFTVAFCAVLCLISHLITNKAAVAVFEILFALVLLVAGSSLYNHLLEPEISSGGIEIISVDDSGATKIQPMEPRPNPDYIPEPTRSALKRVLNALPTGQAILLCNSYASSEEQLDMPMFSYCASVGIIAVSTALGVLFFRRKDLK